MTIFASATPSGGAIAIMRLSGVRTAEIVQRLSGRLPSPRRASLAVLRDEAGDAIDRGLVLWFPGPDTATGEDYAELQVHGGPAVIARLADCLSGLGGAPAEPGEFSRRAFLNGRIDLIEAEGIADLVAAETDEQRRQALDQVEGGLSATLLEWRETIRWVLAASEARIDFPDDLAGIEEDDAPGDDRIRSLITAIADHLHRGRRAEKLRSGVTVVLTGRVNVGKSSLMNIISGQDVAIVADQPGTTRDRIEARVVIGGVPTTLIDTAGLREAGDAVELEGMRRAARAIETADIVLTVCTPDDVPGDADRSTNIIVVNKVDQAPAPAGMLGVSARTGENIDGLLALLTERVARLAGRIDTPMINRVRHRQALENASVELEAAITGRFGLEHRAEHLRFALQHVGSLTGMIGAEELLDTIFGSFCIGK